MADSTIVYQDINAIHNNQGVIAAAINGPIYNQCDIRFDETLQQRLARYRDYFPLSDPDMHRGDMHSSARGEIVPGTCDWIFNHQLYQNWIQDDAHVLWISGGAGKGKTFLASAIVAELESQGREMILYFFCTHGNDTRDNAVAVVRGWIYQILKRKPDLTELVADYVDQENRRNLVLRSFDQVWNIFERILRDERVGPIRCLLDGVDECDKHSSFSLITRLKDISHDSPSKARPYPFRSMVISRNMPTDPSIINIKLPVGSDGDVSESLSRFIVFKVEQLQVRNLTDNGRERVKKILRDKSCDTFLWVGFALNEVRLCSEYLEILEILTDLPSGLFASYDRMLMDIKPKHIASCAQILRWVTLATRPLTLQELAVAIAIKPIENNLLETTRYEINQCGSMVQIQNEIVTLVHQTARDYLLREEPAKTNSLEVFRIRPAQSHYEVARTCLSIIANSPIKQYELHRNPFWLLASEEAKRHVCAVKTKRRTSDIRLHNAPKGPQQWILSTEVDRVFPLLWYAVDNWPKHTDLAENNFSNIRGAWPSFFDTRTKIFSNWLVSSSFQLNFAEDREIVLASWIGIREWVTLSLPPVWSLTPSWLRSRKKLFLEAKEAFAMAVRNGNVNLVTVFLNNGFTAETPLREQTSLKNTMDTAICLGQLEVVRLFLERGFVMKKLEWSHYFNLPVLENTINHQEIMRLLLDHAERDAEVLGVGKQSILELVLHLAIRSNNVSKIRVLLSVGLDKSYHTTWSKASCLGLNIAICNEGGSGRIDAEVIECLLDSGYSPDSSFLRAEWQRNPPWRNLFDVRHFAGLRLLVDAGLDLNLREDRTGLLPLDYYLTDPKYESNEHRPQRGIVAYLRFVGAKSDVSSQFLSDADVENYDSLLEQDKDMAGLNTTSINLNERAGFMITRRGQLAFRRTVSDVESTTVNERPRDSDAPTHRALDTTGFVVHSYTEHYMAHTMLKSKHIPSTLALKILAYADYEPVSQYVGRIHSIVSVNNGASESACVCLAANIFCEQKAGRELVDSETRLEVSKIEFDISSRDQGWSSVEIEGSYDSFSWLEVSILRPTSKQAAANDPRNWAWPLECHSPNQLQTRMVKQGYTLVGPSITASDVSCREEPPLAWYLQCNRVAERAFRSHRVVWARAQAHQVMTDGAGSGEGFLDALQEGDWVLVIARARYIGWVCEIRFIQVTVHYSVEEVPRDGF